MKLITGSALAMAVALAACGGYTPIGEGEATGGTSGSGGTTMTGGSGGTTMTGGSGGTTMTGGSGGTTMTGGSGGTTMTGGSGGTTMTGGTGGTGMYVPCANKACGTQCSVCDPNDMDCAADAVITYCNANGECTPGFPMCTPSACETTMDCPIAPGPCRICDDGSTACATTQCLMGQCVSSYPTCPSGACMTDAECPVSDAPCQMCPDGKAVCPWSKCVNGMCTSGIDGCGTQSPCEGKSCGDACTPCVGSNCDAAAPIMAASFCDENLECQFNMPMCTTKECNNDMECPAIEICMACPDTGSCAAQKCVNGACQWQCEAKDPCGGCGMEQTCVYQVGGPGPSHYACAGIEIPCDPADICGCIAGQGECKKVTDMTMIMAACQCENGLE